MNNKITFKKIIDFFITKIIIGAAVIVVSVALIEWAGRLLLDKTQINDELKNGILSIADAAIALLVYILLFTFYEKRRIKELSASTFIKYASLGFFTGIILQSFIILVIYFAGGYSILSINPVSFLFPGFAAALAAGFVAELLIRGILFRLIEEKLGTINALIFSVLLFVIMHSGVKGATILSVLSTAIQAGILISAVYVYTRSLWPCIFFHFAWDFAEPGIFGGINPGISIDKTLFTSKINGHELLTGGQFGPVHSIQSAILCLIVGLIFLWLAKGKNNFIKPYWKNKTIKIVI
jgi:membrane protease YdiL (CAAX protease family)